LISQVTENGVDPPKTATEMPYPIPSYFVRDFVGNIAASVALEGAEYIATHQQQVIMLAAQSVPLSKTK